jgi:hypothetical protein
VGRVASVDITPQVRVPKNPIIRYARIDLLETSSHARLGFEITLAICMMLVGAQLSSGTPVPLVHWLFEGASGVGAIVFLKWSLNAAARAKEEADDDTVTGSPSSS